MFHGSFVSSPLNHADNVVIFGIRHLCADIDYAHGAGKSYIGQNVVLKEPDKTMKMSFIGGRLQRERLALASQFRCITFLLVIQKFIEFTIE